MGALKFKKDYLQDLDIQNKIANISDDVRQEIQDLSDLTQKTKDEILEIIDSNLKEITENHIEPIEEKIIILNSDENTEGSIKNIIKTTLDLTDEQFDKITEIVDKAIDLEETFMNTLTVAITNAKKDIRGDVSSDFYTLAKIEEIVNSFKEEFNSTITAINENIETTKNFIQSSIPKYEIELLDIDENNQFELTYVPELPFVNEYIEIVEVDENGDMTIISENTVSQDSDNLKLFTIDSEDDNTEYKARVKYFYKEINQPVETEDEGETE